MAVDLIGTQAAQHLNRIFHLTNHHFTVKQPLSTFSRTGHARFRRGPSPSSSSSDSHAPSTSAQSAPAFIRSTHESNDCFFSATDTTSSSSRSTNSSSLLSPVTRGAGEEATVSNGKQFSGLGIVAPTPSFSSRKPPLPSSHRKRHRIAGSRSESENHHVSRSGCHCCKRRKITSKREVIRVPVTGSTVTNIPADDYTWKKYGEKSVTGSAYPRVYYKCSTGKGCPARKSVEVAVDDSRMLVVTYAGEHAHRHAPVPVKVKGGGLTGLVV